MYSVGCPHFTFIYIEMYGKCPYSLGNFLWSRAWLANFLLEGIHKIRWQDLWPPPLSVKRFATKAYIVSLTFGYPLLLLACQRSLWIFPCSLTPIILQAYTVLVTVISVNVTLKVDQCRQKVFYPVCSYM